MTGLLQIDERGRRTRATRLTFNPPVRCPAAMPVYESKDGSGVRCAVERNTLSALRDPQSLTAFCFGDYQLCTSWQQQKDWLAAGQRRHVTEQTNANDAAQRRKEWAELGVEVEMPTEVEVTHFHPEE